MRNSSQLQQTFGRKDPHSGKPQRSISSRAFSLSIGMLAMAFLGVLLIAGNVKAQSGYHRLQLKHGGQYLDADHCGATITLNPGSSYENGACQKWQLVPFGDGSFRLQLEHGGQYLDADHCGNTITLNSGSDYEDGACQRWRMISGSNGFFRLKLEHGGQYLDADHCGNTITLNPGSDYEDGACQLWRFTD